MATVQAGLSSILWHITSSRKAASILAKNRFELKPSEGTDAEESLGAGKYYLSCARSRTSDYLRQSLSDTSVLLKLDGQKLATKYKGLPVDYWQNKGYKNEMEDRVLSPSPFIQPASSYLLEVSCIVSTEQLGALIEIRRQAVMHKVPVVYYETSADLLAGNPSKQVEVPLKTMVPERVQPEPPREYEYKYRGRKNCELAAWLAMWKIPVPPGNQDRYLLIKAQNWEALERVYKVLRYPNDVGQLTSALHNAKSTPYESYNHEREYLDELVALMRKLHMTPKQYFEALASKWHPRST